jgi:hypothetical protein
VTARALGALALALLLCGCAVQQPTGRQDAPRLRCANDPGRGQTYSGDRPLFFLFCIESP